MKVWKEKGKRLKGLKKNGILEDSVEFKQICKIREGLGLGPILVKERECLKCSRKFESEGIQNRMCRSCSYLAARTAPDRGTLLSRYG